MSAAMQQPNILHILTVRYGKNGITRCAMNYIQNAEDARMDLACGFPLPDGVYADFASRNAKAFSLPARLRRPVSYVLGLMRLMRREGYDAVHVHGNSCTMALELIAARLSGVRVRIPHAHNTTCSAKSLHRLMRRSFDRNRTAAFACGEAAGRFLYEGSPFTVIANAVDTAAFRFDPDARARIRTALHAEDRFVLGHVGSFNAQKNHAYLLRIFLALRQLRPDALLVCVGDGETRAAFIDAAEAAHVSDAVHVVTDTDDPAAYYCAMDAFALPSLHEGLPFTLIEAQVSGLPCYASAAVTREADMTGLTQFLPPDAAPADWANAIASGAGRTGRADRSAQACSRVEACGYDIKRNAQRLVSIYRTLIAEARV